MNVQTVKFGVQVQLNLRVLEHADYPSASWKRMFLAQPALCNVLAMVNRSTQVGPPYFPRLESPKGVSMGRLVGFLRDYHK